MRSSAVILICALLAVLAVAPCLADEQIGISVRPVDDSPHSRLPWTAVYGTTERVRLGKTEIIGGADLERANAAVDEQGWWTLDFRLTPAGAEKMRRFSARNIGRRAGILVDGVLVSAPVFRETVSRDLVVTGNFTEDQAKRMATQLNQARIPRREVITVLYRGVDADGAATAQALYQRIFFLKWKAGYLPSRVKAYKGDVDGGGAALARRLGLTRRDLPAVAVVRFDEGGNTHVVDVQRRVSGEDAARLAVERAGADLEAGQNR